MDNHQANSNVQDEGEMVIETGEIYCRVPGCNDTQIEEEKLE